MLAALSLTTDLASGVPFEKGLRTCAVATSFGQALGLEEGQRKALFQAALLRAVGCTSHAPENAMHFVDDVAFQAALKVLDPSDPEVFGRQLQAFGAWVPERQAELAQLFGQIAPTVGPVAAATGCETSRALGPGLGLLPEAVDALDDVYERWDGHGIPLGRRGDELSLIGRVVHVAEQAVFAHANGGQVAALAEVRRRAGGHLDPDLVAAFGEHDHLEVLAEPDLLAHVVASEPGRPDVVTDVGLESLCRGLAVVVDLKGRWLLGHSAHVAEVVDRAAELAGVPDRVDLRCAALLHDLGRVAVSSEVWDRAGPLGPADTERVRLHAYWTARILERVPGLQHLAELAASHHERCDGSGYHRGSRELGVGARLLAAADVFAALTEERPYRAAMSTAEAAAVLAGEVAAGRLDREACAAVVEGAGLPRPRAAWPAGLSDREVEVLRLAAKGLSNREIATRLVLSERTVGHHLAHVYDKTGRRTRAGAAVFAIENGLLPG